jgi:hypothetical protein
MSFQILLKNRRLTFPVANFFRFKTLLTQRYAIRYVGVKLKELQNALQRINCHKKLLPPLINEEEHNMRYLH